MLFSLAKKVLLNGIQKGALRDEPAKLLFSKIYLFDGSAGFAVDSVLSLCHGGDDGTAVFACLQEGKGRVDLRQHG